MTKSISLSQNKFALVDDNDFEQANQFKWHFDGRYAARYTGYKGKKIYLHRFIINAINNQEVDHVNGNKLDNQKSNLRIVTRSQNNYNQKQRLNTSSKFKGVCWHKKAKKWMAYIQVNHKLLYLGLFTNEIEAAKAHNETALKYRGKFAKLNEI